MKDAFMPFGGGSRSTLLRRDPLLQIPLTHEHSLYRTPSRPHRAAPRSGTLLPTIPYRQSVHEGWDVREGHGTKDVFLDGSAGTPVSDRGVTHRTVKNKK
jgi:hypothetical protein